MEIFLGLFLLIFFIWVQRQFKSSSDISQEIKQKEALVKKPNYLKETATKVDDFADRIKREAEEKKRLAGKNAEDKAVAWLVEQRRKISAQLDTEEKREEFRRLKYEIFGNSDVPWEQEKTVNLSSTSLANDTSYAASIQPGSSSNKFNNIIDRRCIRELVHFTRAENLASILKNGIQSVTRINDNGICAVVNDTERRDRKLEGISTSISCPNHLMFYKYRKLNPSIDWVIILISPKILASKKCGFYRLNAAHHKMVNLDIADISTPEALEGMFCGDDSARPSYLRDCDPTDVQAEVMVFDTISPAEIVGIVFEDNAAKERWMHVADGWNTIVAGTGKSHFGTRQYRLSM